MQDTFPVLSPEKFSLVGGTCSRPGIFPQYVVVFLPVAVVAYILPALSQYFGWALARSVLEGGGSAEAQTVEFEGRMHNVNKRFGRVLCVKRAGAEALLEVTCP